MKRKGWTALQIVQFLCFVCVSVFFYEKDGRTRRGTDNGSKVDQLWRVGNRLYRCFGNRVGNRICYPAFQAIDGKSTMEGSMVREVNPKETKRAAAFELWMNAPNPMVTFLKHWM